MEKKKLNIYEKLSLIQSELKAPKGNKNTFGNYNYRSAEDILEAVKPICKKHNTVLVLDDEMIQVGDRYYIMATAKLIDLEETASINASAYARESLTKKGMDDSQITGTASSYARKYAMNGLFNIDDTKDADTDEYQKQTKGTDYNKELKKYVADNGLDINEIAREYKLNAKSSQESFKKVLKVLQEDSLKKDLQDTFDKHHDEYGGLD